MESQFSEKIRSFREQQHLYLRQEAPLIDMDTAQLSKIEKVMRQLKREQSSILVNIIKVESVELLTLWVADRIIDVIIGEDVALKAMRVSDKEIISYRTKKGQ
jgi:hypothetical protein